MIAPVYVVAPAWGEEYVGKVFAEVCLASLLAPSNLPALGRPCVVLVATRAQDWPHLDAHPLTALARQWAEVRPLFFDNMAVPGETGTATFARGHALLLAEAQRAGAVTSIMPADKLWADGDLLRLVALAQPGRRMVLAPGFRMTEKGGAAAGLGSGGVIEVSSRRLAALSVEFMHSQYRNWEAAALACGDDGPGGPWWRVQDDGIIVYSLNWEPVLVDFSHPWPHDVDPLRRWSIDGHYAWWNCCAPEHWYAVRDSDEHLFASPTDEAGHFAPPIPTTVGLVDGYRKQRQHHGLDPLRQRLASVEYLLHGSEVDASWDDLRLRAANAVQESHVEPRERWQLQQEYIGYRHVGRGPYRDVVIVHNHAYSIPIGDGPLPERLFRDGVQPHGRLEDALAACGIS